VWSRNHGRVVSIVGRGPARAGAVAAIAVIVVWVCVVLAVPAASASAYPGALDPSFGHSGIASRTYPRRSASADFLLPSPTGTVVVGDAATTTSTDGEIIVTRVNPSGAFDPSYGSVTPSNGDSWAPIGAVIEPNGRLVVAANGTPGDHYPERIALFGFDSNGHLDPSFGTSGRMLLSEPGDAVNLFIGDDGDLHVAGGTAAADTSLTTGLLLATISQDGQELSAHTVPIVGGDADVSAATPIANGDVLFAGADPDPAAGTAHLFLTELSPDGAGDPGFGSDGTVATDIKNAQVDSLAVDSSGRILVAGAYLGDLGRSVDTPVNGLLVRFTPDGAIDPSFAGGGAPNTGAFEFGSITQRPDGSLLVIADGHLAHVSASGEPDLRFGDGGRAPIGRLSPDGPLAINGNDALVPGLLFPHHGYDNALALSQSSLTGSGIPSPVAKSTIQVAPQNGQIGIRVQLASRMQRLTAATDALLVPRTTDIGDGARYAPYAARVRSIIGRVRLIRVGGSAVVSSGTFSLRRVPRRVAALDFSSPGCGKHTVIQLNGPFTVTAGRHSASNTSHTARIRVSWPCRRSPTIHALNGHLAIKHFARQPKPGSWF
jgi:uncharacterized delta-60 repeat protein